MNKEQSDAEFLKEVDVLISKHLYESKIYFGTKDLDRLLALAHKGVKAEKLKEALEKVNLAACYASEENTDSKDEVLLFIGKDARAALKDFNDDI